MILLVEMIFAIIVLGMILNTVEKVNEEIQNRKQMSFMMSHLTPEQIEKFNEVSKRMENKHD